VVPGGHPLIQAVLFRLIQQQQQQGLQAGMEEFVRGLPVGLILLNWDLRPVLVSDEGYKQALVWNHLNVRGHPKDDDESP
jgi:hypothetical protein